MRTFDINPIFGEKHSVIGEERIYKSTCKCMIRVCTSTSIEAVYYKNPYKNLGSWIHRDPMIFKQEVARISKRNTYPTIKKSCKQSL